MNPKPVLIVVDSDCESIDSRRILNPVYSSDDQSLNYELEDAIPEGKQNERDNIETKIDTNEKLQKSSSRIEISKDEDDLIEASHQAKAPSSQEQFIAEQDQIPPKGSGYGKTEEI